MAEEAVKPNLEVVGGGAEPPKQAELGDMGGAPPPRQETPPTPKQEADARAALLDAMDVKSVEELNYVLDVARIGHQNLLEKAEAEKAKQRSTEEGQAKQRGRVDFLAKYGDKLITGPKGQLLVPADVLQEAVDDLKEDARRIAREESAQTLKAAERHRAKLQQDEVDGHTRFWNDPKNADLLAGVYIDDKGNEVRAADEVNALVNAGVFKPQQAAFHVRDKMNLAKKTIERTARDTERRSSRYEENWNEEVDVSKLPGVVKEARGRLEEIKKKPEGERGSEAMFNIFESSRKWS